jgi:uncharacterized protein
MSTSSIDIAAIRNAIATRNLQRIRSSGHVAYDPDTGRVLQLSRVAWNFYQHAHDAKDERDDVREDDIIAAFEWANYLTEVSEVPSAQSGNALFSANRITALAVGTALDCNLGCKYCYNAHHYDLGQSSPTKRMSFDTFRQTLQVLYEGGQLANHLEIYFVGGEPLLNLPLIEQASAFTAEFLGQHEITYTLGVTTNATRLTPAFVDFAVNKRLGIAISIDGDRLSHDTNRPTLGGQGSYDVVLKNLDYFFKHYTSPILNCRVTTTPVNIHLETVIDHLRGMGFNSIGIGFDNDSLFRTDADAHLRMLDESLGKCAQMYKIAALNDETLHISLFGDVIKTLFYGLRKTLPCRATRGYVGVSPDGSVVPCHRYFGSSRTVLGNVNERFPTSEKFTILHNTEFLPNNQIPKCQSCWARFLCGGECFEVKGVIGTDDSMQGSLCELRYSIFRHGMSIYTDLLFARPDVLPRLAEHGGYTGED